MCVSDCSVRKTRRLVGDIHEVKLKSRAGYASTTDTGKGMPLGCSTIRSMMVVQMLPPLEVFVSPALPERACIDSR